MKKLNQNKKRIFATVLSLVLAMSLVACGEKKEEKASNAASTEATTKAEEKKQEPVVAATTEEEPVEEEIVEETPATLPIPENAGLFRSGTGYTLYPTKFIITPDSNNPESKGLYIQLDFNFDPDTRTITCIQTNSPAEDAPANVLAYAIPQWGDSTVWEDITVPVNLMVPAEARDLYDAINLVSDPGECNVTYDFYPDNAESFEAAKASGATYYEGLMYGTITMTYTFPEQEMNPYDQMNPASYNGKYYSIPDVGQSVVQGVVFGATDYPVEGTNTYTMDNATEYVPQNE